MAQETEAKGTSKKPAHASWLLMAAMGGGHGILHWYGQAFLVILPGIKKEMELSATQAGLLISMRSVISGLVNIPAGAAMDRLRRHWHIVLAGSLLGAGVGYLITGLAPTYLILLAGAGIAGYHPLWHLPAVAVLSQRFPERRGFALSVHGMGAAVGDTLGPFAMGFLLVALPWRESMRLTALPALLLGLAAFPLMRALVAPGRPDVPAGEGKPSPTTRWAEDLRVLLRNRRLLALVVISGLRSAAQSALIPFLAIYLKEDLGMSDPLVGVHVALLTLLGIGTSPVLGLLSDRVGRKTVLIAGMLTTGILVLALAGVGGGWKLTVVVALLGLFVYSLSAVLQAMAQDLVGEGVRATVTGFMFTGNTGFSLASPLVAGWLIDVTHETRLAFLMAAGLLASAAVAVALVPIPPPPVASPKQRNEPAP
ncbi:MAG: MFS transporter [Chloroflexi bacterium]|nr:MFS transporter [Chloroflexota bacterium]